MPADKMKSLHVHECQRFKPSEYYERYYSLHGKLVLKGAEKLKERLVKLEVQEGMHKRHDKTKHYMTLTISQGVLKRNCLQAGCPTCPLKNSVKALRVYIHSFTCKPADEERQDLVIDH